MLRQTQKCVDIIYLFSHHAPIEKV